MLEPKHRAKIKRHELEVALNRQRFIFDAVIDLLAANDYEELSPKQQKAQLLLFYDNEVCNGGHLQYFHNQGIDYIEALLAALDAIGADCQRKIFVEASRKALANPVEQVSSLQEYHELALEREYEDLDMAYYSCRPEIGNELLPAFIEAHFEEFVQLED
jgi:hypothetical protein